MKSRKCLFTTLVFLVALAITPGCGSKDNEAGDGGNNSTTNTTTNTITFDTDGVETCRTDVSSLDGLREAINAGQFLKSSYPVLRFRISIYEKSGIFWVSRNNYVERISRQDGSVVHEYGNSPEAIRDTLISALSNSSYYQRMGSSLHRVVTTSGEIYELDLCYPLAANPVFYFDGSDEQQKMTSWYPTYY